jgi:hypothetical protein
VHLHDEHKQVNITRHGGGTSYGAMLPEYNTLGRPFLFNGEGPGLWHLQGNVAALDERRALLFVERPTAWSSTILRGNRRRLYAAQGHVGAQMLAERQQASDGSIVASIGDVCQ